MELSGLHLLLTYQCPFECDHCFVWGGPFQEGTMTIENIRHILKEAQRAGSIKWIYFEGGEPSLYYATLLEAAKMAKRMGFNVGIVTNAYWAISQEDALIWLKPFANLIEDLSISSDLFHYSEKLSQQAKNAVAAAQEYGVPVGLISIAHPENSQADQAVGQIPVGESTIMYRGRAAEKLTPKAGRIAFHKLTECPFEDLRSPGRIHVDPFGHLHICQGISIGNIFEERLIDICTRFKPEDHPVITPLLSGGPVELVNKYDLSHQDHYADACHLCDQARRELRPQFPDILTPDQVYGVTN